MTASKSFCAACEQFLLTIAAFCSGLKDCETAVWPTDKTVYDWTYSLDTAGWVDWMSTVPPFTPDPDASFSQIIVPTSDTVRYNHLLKILTFAGKHVLFVGDTGTGACCQVLCSVHWQPIYNAASQMTNELALYLSCA